MPTETQPQQDDRQDAPAPGVYEGVSGESYHAMNHGVLSKSRLWDMVIGIKGDGSLELCPAKLKYRIEHPKEDTEAMKEGDALDCKLLEPHEFEQRFIMASSCNVALKSGQRKGEPCGNPGVKMVDGEWVCGQHGKGKDDETPAEKSKLDHIQMSKVRGWARSVMDHPEACKRIRGAHGHQVAMVGSVYGRRYKGRFDIFRKDDDVAGVIVDLKRTAYWQPHRFPRHMLNQGWHVQLFGYTGLAYQHDWIGDDGGAELLIVGEQSLFGSGKDAVYPVEIYQPEDELLSLGGRHLQQLMDTFDRCDERGEWPVVYSPPRSVTVPRWINTDDDEGRDSDADE